ncbi:hypothetical protein ACWC5C_28230 [Streptomyces sp. NPDC001700]
MTHSTSRRRRTAPLLAATAFLAVGLAATPANSAPTWESLPVPLPTAGGYMSLLPFDNQNSYAATKNSCIDFCPIKEKLWQRSGSTWKELQLPTDASSSTLAGTGPNDLWAIGRKDGVSTGTYHVHHYDGTKWSSDLHPDTKRMHISDAEAVSRTSLWGAGATLNDGWHPSVTHWDGQRWDTTTFTDIEGSFSAVDVRSENDIWAVGSRDKNTVPADYQPLAMHYDGTKWSEVPVPETPGKTYSLRNVLSNGPKDVWVISNNHVSHWDGATWTRRDLPVSGIARTIANYDGQTYVGLQPSTPGDTKLLRWSGTSWVPDTSLTTGHTVTQLETTPDGALYALSQRNLHLDNYLARLAPPTAG